MRGGLIGDLAAFTYLQDKDTFFARLTGENAIFSYYGLTLLQVCRFLSEDECGDAYRRPPFEFTVPYCDDAESKRRQTRGQYLVGLCTAGWFDDPLAPQRLNWAEWFDKEEGYARIFAPEIIRLLRTGHSKDVTYSRLGPLFRAVRLYTDWRKSTSALSLLMRAWNCFYHSFDFGSAIHNAVRDMPEDPALMATLTGMMASAMYGNRFYFVKKKYNRTGEHAISLTMPPHAARYTDDIALADIQTRWEADFFKKNNALTNVERHRYSRVESRYEGMRITPEHRSRILRAFETDWENRYGVYLDDGIIYIYRSYSIIGRFRLDRNTDGEYIIHDVTKADDFDFPGLTVDECIDLVMNSVNLFTGYPFLYLTFKFGIPEIDHNPYSAFAEPEKHRMWELERLFYIKELSSWHRHIEAVRASIPGSDSKRIHIAKAQGPEYAAIMSYIAPHQ